jgi:ribosome-associated toxin RatA of RatAB toxin-antitoxin module
MKRMSLLTLCVVVVSGAALVVPAAAQAGDAAVPPEVRAGQIKSSRRAQAGSSVERGRALVLIDAPADRVYEVIQNYAAYKDFMPYFETSRVLSQRGGSALVYVQVKVMRGALKIWAELKLKPRQGQGSTRVIEAKMLKGNVEHLEALWEVTPIDEKRTLVAFEIVVDPDLPMPASFVSDENRKSASKTLKALRERLTPGKGSRS